MSKELDFSSLTVAYTDKALLAKAEALAKALARPLDNQHLPRLEYSADKLALLFPGFLPLSADFDKKNWQKRRDEGKKQGLIRACKPSADISIIDATAGWGRDAAILASYGAKVLMLERNPIIAALLEDALERQEAGSKLPLSLKRVDAMQYLDTLPERNYPDLIYIDPMHPNRQKSALVKKDMQVLQKLLGEEEDPKGLIELARCRVKQKVVVKWPNRLAPLIKPDQSYPGKTIRFDLYLAQQT